MTGIEEACEQMGGQTALAERLGVTQQAVSLWVANGFAPMHRISQIAELTGIDPKRLCDPKVLNAVGI